MDRKMELTRVYKKLAEAQFFLRKLTEQERQMIGDMEPFNYYLSAFLSAARTVEYRLYHEQAVIYPAWRTKWDASLPPQENTLMKFMADDRNVEVHRSGSSRSVAHESVEFPAGTHRVEGGTIDVVAGFGPPGIPAVLSKPTYSFTIDGAERKQGRSVLSSLMGRRGFPPAKMSESIGDNPNRRLSHAGIAAGGFAHHPRPSSRRRQAVRSGHGVAVRRSQHGRRGQLLPANA